MSLIEQISQEIVTGDAVNVKKLVNQALEAGIEPIVIINDGLVPGMDIVGKMFREGDYFIPEVIMCTQAMHQGITLLKEKMVGQQDQFKGKILIGTVQGDVHDIGKNLVRIMLEGAAFNVKDIGIDNTPQKFVEEVKAFQPDILGLSALLSTTMPFMQKTIETLVEEGCRKDLKIIVGGAPVTESFAEKIGADGYAADAAAAVELVKRLMLAGRMSQ
jgi:5-methyltetrahydrofolate--homocysteine methyltransferase